MTFESVVNACAGEPEEDLADEEEGEGEWADLPDVEVDATGTAQPGQLGNVTLKILYLAFWLLH